MTDAGRKLFLNCIFYINRFNGKQPLTHEHNVSRIHALWSAIIPGTPESDAFSPALMEIHKQEPGGLGQYCRDNLELIYHDKVFFVDDELKKLGIESNRQLGTLEKLVELMDGEHGEVARELLIRYTGADMATKAEWQKWLTANRDRIYFSDFDGYRFRVVPEGYLGHY